MKKITTFVLSSVLSAAAFGADFNVVPADTSNPSPELLKHKELFEQDELFDKPVIYTNPKINAEAIAAYEANKAGYSDKSLLPIAVCYMNNNNFAAANDLFDIYLKAVPGSTRAMKGKATANLLLNKPDVAIELFKKVYSSGDKTGLKPLCQTLVLSGKSADLAPYLTDMKAESKTDLDYALFAMIYAMRDSAKADDALITEILKNIDVKTALPKAAPATLENILKIYSVKSGLFPSGTLVIPARAATNASLWVPAKLLYEKALAANAKDTLALRGYALVQYRTGDIRKAASLLRQASDLGDKEAASDSAELFVLSGSDEVWKEFCKDYANTPIKPLVRVAMIQLADRKDNPDIFFVAVNGENSDPLFKDANVKKLMEKVLEKFSKDARCADVKKRLDSAK